MNGLPVKRRALTEEREGEAKKQLREILAHTSDIIRNYQQQSGRLSRDDRKALAYWRGQQSVALRMLRVMGWEEQNGL